MHGRRERSQAWPPVADACADVLYEPETANALAFRHAVFAAWRVGQPPFDRVDIHIDHWSGATIEIRSLEAHD
jgi:hypothetical protein